MAQRIVPDRFLDAGEEPEETLTPVKGYEKAPLVSLKEAVQPIKSLLYDADAMVETARRNSRKPANDLTPDESAAIHLYTMQWPKAHPSLFNLLNERLRSKDRNTLISWFLFLKLFFTALYKLPSYKGVIWRGVRGNLSDQYDEDQIWWGVSSCTETMKIMQTFVGTEGDRTLFTIECINAKDIRAHSYFKNENELLLMPGSYFKVVGKWSPAKNLYMIQLRETTASYETIASPFNTASAITNEVDAASQPSKIDVTNSAPIIPLDSKPAQSNLSTSGVHNAKTPKSGDSAGVTPKIYKTTSGVHMAKTPKSGDSAGVTPKILSSSRHAACQFHVDKSWLDPQYHDANGHSIKKPDELEMNEPTVSIDENILNRVQGSMIGLALGDALGAHVESRPRQYLVEHPVTDLESGGTWGLTKGQFTDDTSMALCLANSLVARRDFVLYDQLVRYKWWFKQGYMSSTGHCFDIEAATRNSVVEFEGRQKAFAQHFTLPFNDMDYLSDLNALAQFNVCCSEEGVAGNGALMRLAPVPLFFYRSPQQAVEYSGHSGEITHGDQKAYDACRYYGALIVGALHGFTKDQLLDKEFYSKHKEWFGNKELHPDIKSIAQGSYQKNGYDEGIRGNGYVVSALEAALWAFWSDNNSFEQGALAAVNLGDDTQTTGAIYGQLAGAYYGYQALPPRWLKHVYARTFMQKLSKWIGYEGACWQQRYEADVFQQQKGKS